MKTKKTTFEKLLTKIQTGSWDDLAYLSMTIEENCYTGRDLMTKNDLAVQEKLLSMIEERKVELCYHERVKAIHKKSIKEMKPREEFQNF